MKQRFTYSGFSGCRAARHPGCHAHDSASFAHDQSTERARWHGIAVGLLRPMSCFTLSWSSSVSIESTEQYYQLLINDNESPDKYSLCRLNNEIVLPTTVKNIRIAREAEGTVGDEFRISAEERERLVAEEVEELPIDTPKYTTYLLNPAINLSQSSRPDVVGQMSEIIEEFRTEHPDGSSRTELSSTSRSTMARGG